MIDYNMPKLQIGDLTVEKPIIQGGMGVGISLSGLASAVANEGGIGVISSVGLGLVNPTPKAGYRDNNKIALREEIRKTRSKTDGIIGLNIMVAVSDFDDLVQIGIEEKVDILFIGAGLPLKLPANVSLDDLKKSNTKVAPIVSSARAAKLIFKSWSKNYNYVPDAVVVEGPKAGGHLGFKREQIEDKNFSLEKLVPEVVEAIQAFEEKFNKTIPVIAAGGVYSGADIYKFMQLGASAVQMGTRFVATHECDASIEFKQKFVDCDKDDITIIQSPVGLPGRALENDFLTDVSNGIKKPFKCPWECLRTCDYKEAPYCIAMALTHARKGNLNSGFAFAGSNAYRIDRIISVKELINSLKKEYEQVSYTVHVIEQTSVKVA
jgi:nitronate monooxygenase